MCERALQRRKLLPRRRWFLHDLPGCRLRQHFLRRRDPYHLRPRRQTERLLRRIFFADFSRIKWLSYFGHA